MEVIKSNYELTIEGIDAGAASIFIELSGGKITVRHGTDNVVLKEIDNAKSGAWDKIWDAINSIESVK